jgi:hypothetical protein
MQKAKKKKKADHYKIKREGRTQKKFKKNVARWRPPVKTAKNETVRVKYEHRFFFTQRLWEKKAPRRFCGSRSSGSLERRRGREAGREVRDRKEERWGWCYQVSRSEAASLMIY